MTGQEPRRTVAVLVNGFVYGQADLESIELHDVTEGHHCRRCCGRCEGYEHDAARHRAGAAAHASDATDPSRPFVVLTKVHTRDCPSVRGEITRAERGQTPEQYHEGWLFAGWPKYVDRETAAASTATRCRTCCPDLPAPYDRRSDPMNTTIRCTGTGWPDGDGKCRRPPRSPFSRALMQSRRR